VQGQDDTIRQPVHGGPKIGQTITQERILNGIDQSQIQEDGGIVLPGFSATLFPTTTTAFYKIAHLADNGGIPNRWRADDYRRTG
jgi:hypothetical protein